MSNYFLRLTLAVISFSVARGFLGRGTYLEGYGDVFGIYCKDFDSSVRIWHRRDIVREGVRRAMVNYYQEVPPQGRDYNHRYGMTLEETYQEYFGAKASPKKFLEAVESLVDSTAEADRSGLGYEPIYHFNNEKFSESQSLMESRWHRLVAAVKVGDVTTARYMLGLSLATLQDFYAHTNWIELGNENIKHDLGLPGTNIMNVAAVDDRTCDNCRENDKSCRNSLSESILSAGKLTSDYIRTVDYSPPSLFGKCEHVSVKSQTTGARGGIGKDLPSSCYSSRSDLHQQAGDLAAEATSFYLTRLRLVIGEKMFLRMLSVTPTVALTLIVDTSASEAVREALAQTMQRLVKEHLSEEYPPQEYIMVIYGKYVIAPSVYRSSNPTYLLKMFNSIFTSYSLESRTAQDLPKALELAAHSSAPGSQIFLLTETNRISRNDIFLRAMAVAMEKKQTFTPIVVSQSAIFRTPKRRFNMKMAVIPDETIMDENDQYVPQGMEEHTYMVHNNDAEMMDEKDGDNELTMQMEEDSIGHRSKRQTEVNKQSLEYFSVVSGSHAIGTTTDGLDEVLKIVSADNKNTAVLYRRLSFTSSHTADLPVDSTIASFRVALYGTFSSAFLTSPDGSLISLSDEGQQKDVQIFVNSPFFKLVEVSISSTASAGMWKLSLDPSDLILSSVIVTAATTLDSIASFYTSDLQSLHPSMHKIEHPFNDYRNYLNVVVSGIDINNPMNNVNAIFFKEVMGSTYEEKNSLTLPTNEPRKNTYIRTENSVPDNPFVVVYEAVDDSGNKIIRESSQVFTKSSSLITLISGREIWSSFGSSLEVPFTLTNTLKRTENFAVIAGDVYGFPLAISRRRVTLGINETVTLSLRITMNSRMGRTGYNSANNFDSFDISLPGGALVNTLTISAIALDSREMSSVTTHVIVYREVSSYRNILHEPTNNILEARRKRIRKSAVMNDENKNEKTLKRGNHYGYNSIDKNLQFRKPSSPQNTNNNYHLTRNHYGNQVPYVRQRPTNPNIYNYNNLDNRNIPTNYKDHYNGGVSNVHNNDFAIVHPNFYGMNLKMSDRTAPEVEPTASTSCDDYLVDSVCSSKEWTMTIKVTDYGLGIARITTTPYSSIPYFNPGDREVTFTHAATCCYPEVTVFVNDLVGNSDSQTFKVGEVAYPLTAGAITGIVLGCVLLLVLIIVAIFFIARRRNSNKKVELRGQRVRTTGDE